MKALAEPDGIPHYVVGLTLLMSVALALVLVSIAVSGPLGIACATLIALVAIPLLVSGLSRSAARRRD